MKSWLRSAAIAAAAMVLVSGCVKVSMDFALKPDGSGSFDIELDIAPELVEMLTAFEEGDDERSIEEACKELMQDGGDLGIPLEGLSIDRAGFEAEQEVVADASNCIMRIRGAWPAGQADLVSALMTESGLLSFERVGTNGWNFEMPFVFDAGEDIGFAALLDFSFVITATLPGQPVDHNADRVESDCDTSTFRWDIDLLDPPPSLMAEADGSDDCRGGGLGTGAIVALVLVGVLVVAVAATLLVRRSRQGGTDPSPTEVVDQP